MEPTILALVGAVGGAGTTRLSLELAGTLAREGRSVAVVDAAYGTQGLAMAVPGALDPDITRVVTEDAPLADALVDLDITANLDAATLDVSGSVAVAPARAPFERLARAKTSQCAQRLAERLSRATEHFDTVIVDVPPVAANQSIAAVTAADRVALVVPASQRGADALAPARDRLRDIDTSVDAVVANRVAAGREDSPPVVESADVAIPAGEERALAAAPVSHAASTAFAAGVAEATAHLTGVEVDRTFEDEGLLESYFPE